MIFACGDVNDSALAVCACVCVHGDVATMCSTAAETAVITLLVTSHAGVPVYACNLLVSP